MRRVFFACHLILFFYIISPAAHSQNMRCDTLHTHITFRQGYSLVESQFADNAVALKQMGSWLDSLANTPGVIKSLSVKGSASPEGYASNNRRLSMKRAQNIAQYIISHQLAPDSAVTVEESDIDWDMLRRMALEAGQPWSEEVAGIIENTPVWIFDDNGKIVDGRKKQLGLLQGGKPWFYMAEHFFPAMRNAGFTIICKREIPAPAETTDTADSKAAYTAVADTITTSSAASVAVEETYPVEESIAPVIETAARPHITALLKTNMLYDALAVPNVALEVALGDRWSVEAGWMYAGWKSDSHHRSWRVNGGELGARYWLKPHRGDSSLLTGHHIGIYGQMLTYDFQFGGKGYIADQWSYGAGIAYGYSLPVARHLNIDFTIGVGYLGGKYKKYHPADDCDIWDATYTRNWIGPTKAEISLVWYIGGNKVRKGGSK